MQHSIVVYRLLIGLCFFLDFSSSSSPPLFVTFYFVVVVAQEKKYEGEKRLFLMMRQDYFLKIERKAAFLSKRTS